MHARAWSHGFIQKKNYPGDANEFGIWWEATAFATAIPDSSRLILKWSEVLHSPFTSLQLNLYLFKTTDEQLKLKCNFYWIIRYILASFVL